MVNILIYNKGVEKDEPPMACLMLVIQHERSCIIFIIKHEKKKPKLHHPSSQKYEFEMKSFFCLIEKDQERSHAFDTAISKLILRK